MLCSHIIDWPPNIQSVVTEQAEVTYVEVGEYLYEGKCLAVYQIYCIMHGAV